MAVLRSGREFRPFIRRQRGRSAVKRRQCAPLEFVIICLTCKVTAMPQSQLFVKGIIRWDYFQFATVNWAIDTDDFQRYFIGDLVQVCAVIESERDVTHPSSKASS